MAFVQSSILFRGLEPDALSVFFKQGVIVEHGAAVILFDEGDTDDALFLVLEGSVCVHKRHKAAEVEIAVLEREGVFGEISVLANRPRSARVITRTDVRLVQVPGALVRAVATAYPKLGRKLAGLMAGRNKDTEKKLGG